MSRYIIDNPVGWPADYQVAVGWDEGLQTYFAQVFNHINDARIVWIGTFETINSVDQLQKQLNAELPLVELSPVELGVVMKRTLEADRRAESEEG